MPTKRESKKEQGRGESLIVPMTVIMMRQGYDYWQNKVLLAIIDKLQPYIREGLQIDLFGIQEDIILSIRYKDLVKDTMVACMIDSVYDAVYERLNKK
mgnify:CR=1 FL=1